MALNRLPHHEQERPAFAANLRLAMVRLNLSGVELAQRLAVDKSVVRRWLSGSGTPGPANLSRLTELVSRTIPAISRDLWFDDASRFAARVQADAGEAADGYQDFLPVFTGRALTNVSTALARYGGSWAMIYAPVAPATKRIIFWGGVEIYLNGQHLWMDISDGPRGVWTGGGPVFAVDTRLWVIVEETQGRNDICPMLFIGTSGQRAMILDGLVLARTANVGGVPVCGRFTLFRLGDHSDDPEARRLRHAEIVQRAGALSSLDLAPSFPAWLVDLLVGDGSKWSERHQAYILTLPESESLTTDEVDIDLLSAGGRTRREALDCVRQLFLGREE